MGLVLAALQVCGIGFLWVLIAAIACVNAYKTYGPWTLLYFIFSFYWIQQVLSNVVSVATAGKIGRWFVLGESTPDLNTGLQVSVFGFLCSCMPHDMQSGSTILLASVCSLCGYTTTLETGYANTRTNLLLRIHLR